MSLALVVILATIPMEAQRRRAVGPRPVEAELHILFIGNSLTAGNDLPAIVCRLAEAGGHRATCESVVGGGYALEDHFADGRAPQRLEQERWSIVVLQQGPSALESSRVNLREWTAKFASLITAAGARPALYAVWPAKARSFDFPRVSQSYRIAATDVGGLFFPAGDAWLAAWRRDASLPLYGGDEFHPSAAGSYLAALVIYRVLWGELPPLFADRAFVAVAAGSDPGLDASRLAILTAAAEEGVAAGLASRAVREIDEDHDDGEEGDPSDAHHARVSDGARSFRLDPCDGGDSGDDDGETKPYEPVHDGPELKMQARRSHASRMLKLRLTS